jgi:hypothetical protein
VKYEFHVPEGTMQNECKINDMKIYVAVEVTHTKLILP